MGIKGGANFTWNNPETYITAPENHAFTATIEDPEAYPDLAPFYGEARVEVLSKLTPTIVSAKVNGDNNVEVVVKDHPRQIKIDESEQTLYTLRRYVSKTDELGTLVCSATESTTLIDDTLFDQQRGFTYYYRVFAAGAIPDNPENPSGISEGTPLRAVKVPAVAPVITSVQQPDADDPLLVSVNFMPHTKGNYLYAVHRVNVAGKSLGIVSGWSENHPIRFYESKSYLNKEVHYALVAQALSKELPPGAPSASEPIKLTGTLPTTPTTPIADIPLMGAPTANSDLACVCLDWVNPSSYYASVTRYTKASDGRFIPTMKTPYTVSTNYVDCTVPPGVTVYYSVKFARDAAGRFAGKECDKKDVICPIGEASYFHATREILVKAIKLTWKAPKGGNFVKITRRRGMGPITTLVEWQKMSSYTDRDPSLVENDGYEYIIQFSGTNDGSTASEKSKSAVGRIKPVNTFIASKIQNIKATQGESEDYVRLTWKHSKAQPPSDLAQLLVYRSSDPKFDITGSEPDAGWSLATDATEVNDHSALTASRVTTSSVQLVNRAK